MGKLSYHKLLLYAPKLAIQSDSPRWMHCYMQVQTSFISHTWC